MNTTLWRCLKRDTVRTALRAIKHGETLQAAYSLRYLTWIDEAHQVLTDYGAQIKAWMESPDSAADPSRTE